MASINSVMGGGAASSIYGNRNVLSGLASGMDTESMIENAISGYKMKLGLLNQQRTVVEWQQSAYRGIIDKLVAFSRKYTTFSSGNNLGSESFFDSAINVVSQGANADRISASGKTDSRISIDSVSQIATSTRYTVGADRMNPSNVASGSFNINETTRTGKLDGSMTIRYGGKDVVIDFSNEDVFESADKMAEAINDKLKDVDISFNSGSQDKASNRIKAVADADGKSIHFEKTGAGVNDTNEFWIYSATSDVKEALKIDTSDEDKHITEFAFDADKVSKENTMVGALAESGFAITVDGVSKTVKGPTMEELEKAGWHKDFSQDEVTAAKEKAENAEIYMEAFQNKINEAFGAGKLTVSNALKNGADDHPQDIRFKFEASAPHSKFSVTAALGEKVGMKSAVSSYVNTKKTLGDLLDDAKWSKDWRIEVEVNNDSEVEDQKTDPDTNLVTGTKDGYKVAKDPDTGKWYRVDDKGNALVDFKINGKSVGTFSKDSTLSDVMNAINRSENSDVKVSYSEFTKTFTFTARDTGAGHNIAFNDGLADALFGGQKAVDGQDAVFSVSVNGQSFENMTQSSNEINIDGMNITLKGTFDSDPVTFNTKTNTDKIVDVVKDMVKDYNEMASLIRNTYTTMPQTDSKGKPYMPLTDKDREKMSESEIKNYEEKAKQGILFGDRDLDNLYDGLRDALYVLGTSSSDAQNLGITTSFEGGATTITLDEEKLKQALEQDPEKVKDVFTRSRENGDSSDGLIAGMKKVLDQYARTTGATKGLLIEKAGSTQAPTSIFQNELQRKLGNFDKQIASWQTKIADKIDYYNHKFTILEQMIAEMNNQSGMLMGLQGGY